MYQKWHLLVFIASLNCLVVSAIPLIQESPENMTTFELNPNDLLELECEFPIAFNNTIKNGSALDHSFKLGIFKKDKTVIQLHRPSFKHRIENVSDQGVYECGYFDLNQHGNMIYHYQNSWFVKVLGKFTSSLF